MNISESVVVISVGNESASFLQFAKESLELLISTPAGMVPLDRNFGLDQSFLSLPSESAKTLFAQELIEKAEIYIPEISITEIESKVDSDGTIQSVITVCKNADYEVTEDEYEDLSTEEDAYYYDDQDPDADNYIEGDEIYD